MRRVPDFEIEIEKSGNVIVRREAGDPVYPDGPIHWRFAARPDQMVVSYDVDDPAVDRIGRGPTMRATYEMLNRDEFPLAGYRLPRGRRYMLLARPGEHLLGVIRAEWAKRVNFGLQEQKRREDIHQTIRERERRTREIRNVVLERIGGMPPAELERQLYGVLEQDDLRDRDAVCDVIMERLKAVLPSDAFEALCERYAMHGGAYITVDDGGV